MRRERGERQLNEEREKRVRWIFCGRGFVATRVAKLYCNRIFKQNVQAILI
jgi:hypothetical protein